MSHCARLSPGGNLSTNIPFPGHLPCNYHCPRRTRFVAHGARSHTAPRIPPNPLHCTYDQYDGDQPSREPFASEVRSASDRRTTSRADARRCLGRVGVRGRARVHERVKERRRDHLRSVTSESLGGATRDRRNVCTQDIESQGAGSLPIVLRSGPPVQCIVL